jgi:hypothetical protein
LQEGSGETLPFTIERVAFHEPLPNRTLGLAWNASATASGPFR